MKFSPLRNLILASACSWLAACGESPAPEDAGMPAAEATQATQAAPAGAQVGAWGIDLTARDTGVHPGDDFDRYANGKWFDDYEIPSDLARFGLFVELGLEAEEDVRAIVEELGSADAAPGSLEQKVGDFYASWMNTDLLEELGAGPLETDLAFIDSIATKEELKEAFANLHLIAPFSIGIIPDPADTTRYIAFVEQSGLGMPDRDYYLDQSERFAEYRAAYSDLITTLFDLAGRDVSPERVAAIVDLETRIAEVHWTREESRDIQRIYNPMAPAELAELAPEIPWLTIFEALGLADVETFVVAQTTAIDAAAEIIEAAPLGLLKDYLTFHFISDSAPYLSSPFDAANFEFFSRTLQGSEEQRERWKRGVQQINAGLGEAVGQIYVQRHFPPEAEAGMNTLVANLVAAMEERLRENEWMDEPTRERALGKLATFEPRIGYPSKWTDYGALQIDAGQLLQNRHAIREFTWQLQVERLSGPVDRALWEMSPQTVNAYYNPLLNQITFPAAILQPPFFDPEADAAVNYGAIGAVIGHEIGHGFDDQGRRFDEQGRIRDWWTETADQRFAQRSEQLGAQYDAYEPLPGMTINGQLTMGENIGDLGGLQMAYAAYQRYLDENTGGEAPVIDGLSGDQRFFLAWAQVWRGKAREDYTRAQLVSDPHSPPRYRINGVVRNLDAWYDAFDVTPEHALYLPPEQRVRIW